jgi:hypothetical protein
MIKFTEPGKWYFAVDCAQCGKAIPFAEAPSPEDDPTPKCATIVVWCPNCQFEAPYARPLISRQEGPERK